MSGTSPISSRKCPAVETFADASRSQNLAYGQIANVLDASEPPLRRRLSVSSLNPSSRAATMSATNVRFQGDAWPTDTTERSNSPGDAIELLTSSATRFQRSRSLSSCGLVCGFSKPPSVRRSGGHRNVGHCQILEGRLSKEHRSPVRHGLSRRLRLHPRDVLDGRRTTPAEDRTWSERQVPDLPSSQSIIGQAVSGS